ncbi:MAG: YidC/Oxa1 family membrane protein insertase [Patescibacteria group bacterium]
MELLTTVFYQPFYNLLFFLISVLPGESLGLGIIALTFLVRLLLLPTSAQAVRAQRELQALQPEIDALRTTYKDQPEELNKKIFALYQEHKVNPLGSCLPLLIQLPILLILYRVFISGINGEHLDLLYSFVPAPEHLQTLFLGVDLHTPSILLAVLSGALQFIQTWQLMRKQPKPAAAVTDVKKEPTAEETTARISRSMAYIMPLLTIYIGTRFPAGLAIYWIVTTLFSIVQQWWLFRTKPSLVTPHVTVQIRDHK